jgi:hypothetical protein
MPETSERWRTLPDGSRVRNVDHALERSAGDEPVTEGYSSMKKDELVSEAEARGLDSSGTKEEIIARLEGGA